MTTLRCGRLDDHEPHEWSTPRVGWRQTYHCTGHVLTSICERRWADACDAEDAADDERRPIERGEMGGWVG